MEPFKDPPGVFIFPVVEEYHHGRQDAHRIGSSGLPALGRASPFAYGRAEYRHDESRRLLPQLSVELDERGRRHQRAFDEQRRKPGDGLRYAIRRMAPEIPERSVPGTEGGVRKVQPSPLVLTGHL